MAEVALQAQSGAGTIAVRPKLDRGFDPRTALVFAGLLGAGLLFVAYSLYADLDASGATAATFLPHLLLFVALLIALGFEFVNGFHDTANAVATVIYTHSLPAEIAVVWVRELQLPRGTAVEWRRGLRHHFIAAGRADPSGREFRGFCDGVSRW